MKTIALANQKGGVGKTTTAASLAIGLSRQGKKVLLVDADAQGNLTQMLGWPQPDELSPTLADLMGKIITDQPVSANEGILHHDSGVDLLPANIELSALEVTLVNAMSRETVMRQLLSTVQDRYDYALIDCMPSLGIMREEKPLERKVTLWNDKLERFFPKSYTPKQMEDVILKLLEGWQRKRQQEQAR